MDREEDSSHLLIFWPLLLSSSQMREGWNVWQPSWDLWMGHRKARRADWNWTMPVMVGEVVFILGGRGSRWASCWLLDSSAVAKQRSVSQYK